MPGVRYVACQAFEQLVIELLDYPTEETGLQRRLAALSALAAASTGAGSGRVTRDVFRF